MGNYKRKYPTYRVVVNNINGDKQEFNFQGIQGNYKAMLDRYSEIKEKYGKDKEVLNIQFVGVTEDNKVKIIYTKNVNQKDNNTPFDDIKEKLNYIRGFGINYSNYEKWHNKKLLELTHRLRDEIEYSDTTALLKLAVELKKLEEERKITKNRSEASNMLFKTLSWEKLLDMDLEECAKVWDSYSNFDKNNLNKNLMCYRAKYNTEEEKEKIINKLQQEKWEFILELPDNYIGYYNSFLKDKIEKRENKRKEEKEMIGLETELQTCFKKDQIRIADSNELPLMVSAVPTFEYGEKIPRIKKEGKNVLQIKCKTKKQVIACVKENENKYNEIIFIKDKKTLRFLKTA